MSDIKIIALGGVRENGKNLYIAESKRLYLCLGCWSQVS